MFELMKGIQSILEAVEAVRPGERALIIADNEGEPMWIGQIITNVVTLMGAEAVMMVITPTEVSAQEPPASVAAAMKAVNVIFRVSNRGNLGHTVARREATAAGAKFYSIQQIPLDDLKQGVSAADIQLIKERTEKLAQMLTQAKVARVSTPSGTNVTLGLTSREGVALNPMSQIIASLPYYAEAAIAPVEGTAEGIIVADLEVVNWGYLLQEPLRYTVKGGKVVNISGSKETADRLREIVTTNEKGKNIAEIGIVTSHIIPLQMYGTRRDAARIGTAHIGLGRNDAIGGITWSPIHWDSLMSQAIVELDDHCILRDGALLI